MEEMKMRRLAGRETRAFGAIGVMVLMTLAAVMFALPGKSWTPVTRHYGNVTLSGSSQAVYFDDYWDLTKGDLVMSYTIDLNGVTPKADKTTSWTSVGLADKGWVASGAPGAFYQNPNKQDVCDKHNLGASPYRYDESSYDATDPDTLVTAPIGVPWSNYGVCFDRTGMDQWQVLMWGSVDGGTYNTGGLYDIVMTAHSISPTLGTMFNTVNGIQTGIYQTGWKNAAPENYPVGKSINGDLTKNMIAAWIWALDDTYGSVQIDDLTVTGYLSTKDVSIDIKPGSVSNPICLKENGLLPVAILGSSDLDVHDINPETIQAGEDPFYVDIATRGSAKAPKLAFSYEDVNKDGRMDMMVFFSVPSLVAEGGLDQMSTQLSVTGELYNGVPIKGVDSVVVVP